MAATNSPIKNRVVYTERAKSNIVETADPYTKSVHFVARDDSGSKENDGVIYDLNDRSHVLQRLNDKFGHIGLINKSQLGAVCEWLEYPLCSFELEDAQMTLAYDKNGNIPIESVVDWFLNLEKFGLAKATSSNFQAASFAPRTKGIKDDPVHLQNYMSLLKSKCTEMDGDISNLEVLKSLTMNQLDELKEKLNLTFTRSYDLYNDVESIDAVLKQHGKDFDVIVGGTKGLTNVLKGFLGSSKN